MKRRHLLIAAAVVAGCTENLPSGPESFTATVRIVAVHDTLVVGDSSVVTAQATDAAGNVIQALQFRWASGDSSTIAPKSATLIDGGNTGGAAEVLSAKKPGHATITASLVDARFVAAATTRNETAVVGGVRLLSSRDTTLTALGDTATAIAAGLVRINGALAPRASQGTRWTHLGTRTTVVGQGDTIRYIARANGADTLIATNDLCLAGAKCADTAIVRANQQLSMTVSPRTFSAFSFGDSVGPSVTLADRRGNGLVGTSVRLVPVTAADSAIVRTTAAIGTSNFATGVLAVPRLVATGNGTARVAVQGLAPDGTTILASDTIAVVVRQVARTVNAEPLSGVLSVLDSIPVIGIARDARGATIADATVTLSAQGTTLNGIWAGPNTTAEIGTAATLVPTLTGIAVPQNNPAAPQIAPVINPALLSLTKVDSLGADTASLAYDFAVLDSLARPATGSWVRLRATGGSVPDSVQVGPSSAFVAWTPPKVAGTYTLTAVRSAPILATLADSAGRIVLRRSVVILAGAPSAPQTNADISATTIAHGATATITVTVKDKFGNIVKTAKPTDVVIQATSGTVGPISCTAGVCTATYTAPAAAGNDQISVTINGVDVVNSPIILRIT